MGGSKWGSRVLGIAFLFQFVTSVISGVIVKPALVVPEDAVETMVRIAGNPGLMRSYILLDMLTALGIVFLGVMLYITLRKAGERMALVGLGFYILEGALLGASKLQSYTLLRASELYVPLGRPEYLRTLAKLALESSEFVGFTLHMLVFCVGAALFYYLMTRSRVVPRWLSLWGLISLTPLVVATVLSIMGVAVPDGLAALAIPYFPFELAIGVWVAVKGVADPEVSAIGVRAARAA